MKVLIISHTYISPVNRTKWLELARQYPEADLTVLIPNQWKTSFFDVDGSSANKDSIKNCRFISLKAYFTGNEQLYFYNPYKLAQLLRTVSPDIIQVEQGLHAISYFQVLFFNKILRINAKCCFFTWVNWQPRFNLKTKILTKILEFFNLAGSTGAIAGNHDAKNILSSLNPTLPILVLPQLGVNTQLFKPARHIPHSSEKKHILYVGRIVEEKGLITLIKAFEKIASQHPLWDLLIIGAGPFEKQLIDYVLSKKLLHRIDFLAPMSHEKVATILPTAEILVLPSIDTPDWREQFGHILIEAMACRTCVVGSDAGEIPRVIADAGITFKQGNAQALYDALNILITQDALRNNFAQKGLDRVLHLYTHRIIAEKTYNFWKLLISKKEENLNKESL